MIGRAGLSQRFFPPFLLSSFPPFLLLLAFASRGPACCDFPCSLYCHSHAAYEPFFHFSFMDPLVPITTTSQLPAKSEVKSDTREINKNWKVAGISVLVFGVVVLVVGLTLVLYYQRHTLTDGSSTTNTTSIKRIKQSEQSSSSTCSLCPLGVLSINATVSGDPILPGTMLRSPNGRFFMQFTDDIQIFSSETTSKTSSGQTVVTNGTRIWKMNLTHGILGDKPYFRLFPTGKWNIYDTNNNLVWTNGVEVAVTNPPPLVSLVLSTTGILQVTSNGVILWSNQEAGSTIEQYVGFAPAGINMLDGVPIVDVSTSSSSTSVLFSKLTGRIHLSQKQQVAGPLAAPDSLSLQAQASLWETQNPVNPQGLNNLFCVFNRFGQVYIYNSTTREVIEQFRIGFYPQVEGNVKIQLRVQPGTFVVEVVDSQTQDVYDIYTTNGQYSSSVMWTGENTLLEGPVANLLPGIGQTAFKLLSLSPAASPFAFYLGWSISATVYTWVLQQYGTAIQRVVWTANGGIQFQDGSGTVLATSAGVKDGDVSRLPTSLFVTNYTDPATNADGWIVNLVDNTGLVVDNWPYQLWSLYSVSTATTTTT